MRRIAIRVDASAEIGGGHAVRCLTLADELAADGSETHFVTSRAILKTVGAIARYPISPDFNDLKKTWTDGADLVVFDSYAIDADIERAVRPWAHRVAAIDDIPNRKHDVDVLIDQTYGRLASDYGALLPSGACVLAGSDYAMVRPEFRARRGAALARRDGTIRRVMVAIGLSDPHNATSMALAGIAAYGLEVEVDVVIGSICPHLASIRETAMTLPRPARIHIDANNVADLMAAADIAIGAGGATAWERGVVGLPSLVLIVADNQVDVASALATSGAAVVLGRLEDVDAAAVTHALSDLVADPDSLRSMSYRAAALCDGLGARRVVAALETTPTSGGAAVALRPLRASDGDLLLSWQRDPSTRRHSRNPRPPEEAEHWNWLDARLADPLRVIEIIEHNGVPAGVIRLERATHRPTDYEVSIMIAPECRRLGIAERALTMGHRLLPEAGVVAEILPGNSASEALFLRAGFRREAGTWFRKPPLRSVA